MMSFPWISSCHELANNNDHGGGLRSGTVAYNNVTKAMIDESYLNATGGTIKRNLGSSTCNRADPSYDGNSNDNLYYIIYNGGDGSNNKWHFLHHGKGDNSENVRWTAKGSNNLKPCGNKYKWKFGLDGAGDATTEFLNIKDYGDVTGQLLGRESCTSNSNMKMYNSISDGADLRFHYTKCNNPSYVKNGYLFSGYAKGKFVVRCSQQGVPNRALVKDGSDYKTHASSSNYVDGTEVWIIKISDVTSP